jgi:hypothetical protein
VFTADCSTAELLPNDIIFDKIYQNSLRQRRTLGLLCVRQLRRATPEYLMIFIIFGYFSSLLDFYQLCPKALLKSQI